MKFRMVASLLALIFLQAIFVSGNTMSWLTSKASPTTNTAFTVGTIDIELTGEHVTPQEFRWEIDEGADGRDFTWTIRNTGSKRVFLRTWLEEEIYSADETAWGEGETFVDSRNWAMNFFYGVGHYNENNPKAVRLLAGQHHEAGTVKVWEAEVNDIPTLYVKYTAADWKISQLHLAVVDDLGLIPLTPGGPQVGRFPFNVEFDELKGTYTFAIPMQGVYPMGALEGRPYDWTDTENLYIAAHADLIGMQAEEAGMKWPQRDCEDQWFEYEGYWYYCLEPLAAGEEVTLCLTGYPEKSGLYTVKLNADAVQALPEAVEKYWDGNLPCLLD